MEISNNHVLKGHKTAELIRTHSKLTLEQKGLALIILSHRNEENFNCFPRQSTLAKESGKSQQWVSRAISVLQKNKILIGMDAPRPIGHTGKYYNLQYWFIDDIPEMERIAKDWEDELMRRRVLDDIQCATMRSAYVTNRPPKPKKKQKDAASASRTI